MTNIEKYMDRMAVLDRLTEEAAEWRKLSVAGFVLGFVGSAGFMWNGPSWAIWVVLLFWALCGMVMAWTTVLNKNLVFMYLKLDTRLSDMESGKS